MSRAGKSTSGRPMESGSYPYLLLVPFAFVLILNLLGIVFPSVYTWGFNVWGAFPLVWFLGLVLLMAAMAVPPVFGTVAGILEKILSRVVARGRIIAGAFVSAVSCLVGAVFVMLRSNAPFYGDGYTVIASSTVAISGALPTFHERIKVVPVWLYRLGGSILSKQMHLSPQDACGIVSCLGGVVGFWGLWRLSWALAKRDVGRALAFMSVGLAGGCTVLFFGHLELYTWPMAISLWTLAAAVDFVNGRGRAVTVWLWLAITLVMQAMFFPMALVIALMLLAHRDSRHTPGRPFAFGLTYTKVGLGLGICSVVAGALFMLVPKEGSFTPLWPTERVPYWVLSPSHLIDLFNVFMVAAPLLLATLVLFWFARKKTAFSELGNAEKLLGLCALALFLVTFWIDPELGALRDWDLLSFFGFAASMFAGVLLLTRFPGRRAQSLIIALSMCLVLVIVAPHVVERRNGPKALKRLDAMVWKDLHYQTTYDKGHMALIWGALTQTYNGELGLADRYLWRKLSVDPESDYSWFNLGEIELNRKHYDSAVVCIEHAYRLHPTKGIYLVRYAEALQYLHRDAEVNALLPDIAALQTDDTKALGYAGIVLANAGRLNDALPKFRRAYDLRPWEYRACMNLGLAFHHLGVPDSAAYYFQQALPSVPPAERPPVFSALLLMQMSIGRFDEAQRTLEEFRRQFPNDTLVAQAQKVLDEHR